MSLNWLFGPSRVAETPSSAHTARPAGLDSDEAAKCPVDHSTRSRWLAAQKSGSEASTTHPFSKMSVSASGPPKPAPKPKPSSSYVLSTDRETSSIPRYISSNPPDNAAVAAASCSQSSNWVYPSPSQFFTALERKNRNPDAADMDIVVPIHNAVNERTWKQVLEWEEEAAPDAVNKVKLVSFKGRPNDRTPRAWFKVLLGYQAPFDRHDWTIDRDGKRIRYVIDFYTGRGGQPAALPAGPTLPLQLAFYLDVRPAFDDFESIRMRFRHGLNSLVGLTGPPKQTKLG